MSVIISVRDLSVRYGAETAVGGVSFDVAAADHVCVVGKNGSGKTTLIKCLAGLLKPSSGAASLGGELRRCDIGYMPQHTNLRKDFPASVREIALSGCLNRSGFLPFYSASDKARMRGALAALGLGGLERRSFRELSGGQRQRVLLARALCAGRKALVLDECANGLDQSVKADFNALLASLNRDHGIAIIEITHDIESAISRANKILHLNSGGGGNGENRAAHFFGAPAEYATTPLYKSLAENPAERSAPND